MKNECATFQRWFSYLAEFDFSVVFRPGRLNTNADALSRLPQPDSGQPEELLMQIENSEKTELLARFAVDLLWGEDWWGEIHREQTNPACLVMVWLDYAIGERSDEREATRAPPS